MKTKIEEGGQEQERQDKEKRKKAPDSLTKEKAKRKKKGEKDRKQKGYNVQPKQMITENPCIRVKENRNKESTAKQTGQTCRKKRRVFFSE